ncbi:outer membrane protein assembly factor BamD [Rickettsia typhi]|uniref:Outer membrane protein assembly factor BamD n=2 Tax=Rickettsia typhi TaxID=785 RepID=Q68XI4_RICTY|nr:outer membrane protein assembly factor BamD [Rickettsia typhi]AAU03658.1 probable lipoprotein [Rickettsia typhi str. Wilmington]AFE54036.1 lipoprotein [Rickettsia typhi str. TH1527]AFE54875.1 lipoprotein [Rickettsia typhi str. B9991CWPP]
MKLTKLLSAFLVIGLILSGCKSKKNSNDIVVPIATLYNEGIILLDKKKYKKAAEEFGKIFYQHPGNEMTPQAELMQAYALFLAAQYEEAVDILDMFINLHPANVDIAYAYYLKALSYYMLISDVNHDQSRTFLSKDSFEDVITKFPNTKYAIDASLKIDLVNDHLAGKEMMIGRFYLKKKNPIAAINRFEEVIDNYQTTYHSVEALYRLVESYMMLGLHDEAKKYASVLGYNYPDSKWYSYAYRLVKNYQN